MLKYIIFIIIGFILLLKGADFLVDGAGSLAKKFRIPDIVIGLTIVSIGTSMPELFVSITSSFQNASDISVGNVIGSNLCNLLLILGATAIIKDIKFKNTTKYIELPFLILTNIILFVLVQDGILSQKESCLLVFLFICFLTYTYLAAKREQTPETTTIKEVSILKSIASIIIRNCSPKIRRRVCSRQRKRLGKTLPCKR
ncbi:MAG: sodium:calcium antiporter [Clostridia bacterium]|nr:sodium:calcium antiporter [Clostridia bacterium]